MFGFIRYYLEIVAKMYSNQKIFKKLFFISTDAAVCTEQGGSRGNSKIIEYIRKCSDLFVIIFKYVVVKMYSNQKI